MHKRDIVYDRVRRNKCCVGCTGSPLPEIVIDDKKHSPTRGPRQVPPTH